MRPVEQLALIGVSQARGGIEALEALHARFPDASAVTALGFEEAVTVATCNRFEAVVALPEGSDCRTARRLLGLGGDDPRLGYAFRGEGALEHLARVAASLESVNPGEDQVMRQVRAAYSAAQATGSAGPLMSFAFESALRVAKRVRREVRLAPINASLFTLALPLMEAALPRGAAVAVVGLGEMGSAAARALARSDLAPDLFLVNRDERRGRALADEQGAQWVSLDDLLAGAVRLDAVVCATPRAGLLGAEVLARLPGLRVAVDLGLPRNVDAVAARDMGVQVVSHEELQQAGHHRRAQIAERLAEAEAVLLEELDTALDAWTDRQIAPAIRRLRSLYRDTIGDTLPDAEASALAHRFAHVPVKGLRALARRYGVEAATTFLETVDAP